MVSFNPAANLQFEAKWQLRAFPVRRYKRCVCAYRKCAITTARRDGFMERGALGHLSFGAPKQV